MESSAEAWNMRAIDDPYHWMMTEKRGWKRDEFYETGRKHVVKYLLPLNVPFESTVVDIGCGVGRITRWMPYRDVIGTDISSVLIREAESNNPGICFQENDSTQLGLEDGSVDLAFSYATFQHLPDKKKLVQSFSEVFRILKDGGRARLNVRGFPGRTIGQTLWWKSFRFHYLALGLWHYLPILYLRRYDTLYGVPLHDRELAKLAKRSGLIVLSVWRESAKSLWVDAIK